jgi:hypothetical protein
MDFVLTLAEGLKRLEQPVSPDALKYLASSIIVPLEYETLNRIQCPQCSKHTWERLVQFAVPAKPNMDWPFLGPGGDRLDCQCKNCGHAITVNFWFTRE